MFENAIKDATRLDEYMRTHGKPMGPLHGLPISVKEHIYFKDTPATAGFIAWADDFSTEDALVVKILREAGAVFHVKTTNPQSLMVRLSFEGTPPHIYSNFIGFRDGEQSLWDDFESAQYHIDPWWELRW
jgi:Asp-tRNA(Asn)/Glu-tRNA(Gln) amidotransferase A subunit family amidase